MYHDTLGILEEDQETLKWGEVYHMLKNSIFSSKNEDEIKMFNNI